MRILSLSVTLQFQCIVFSGLDGLVFNSKKKYSRVISFDIKTENVSHKLYGEDVSSLLVVICCHLLALNGNDSIIIFFQQVLKCILFSVNRCHNVLAFFHTTVALWLNTTQSLKNVSLC